MAFKFREWPVYKEARKFRQEVLKEIVPQIPKSERFELTGQLKKALDSIILNIAEGAYRKSDKDLAHFLNQADTSLNEVVSCLDLCLDDKYISAELHKKFLIKSEKLVSQIIAFRKFLQK